MRADTSTRRPVHPLPSETVILPKAASPRVQQMKRLMETDIGTREEQAAEAQPLSEMVLFTPDLAAEFRQNYHFERQRPIRPDHVKYLAGQIQEGLFNKATPVTIGVLPDRTWVILNGNHTLEAITLSGLNMLLTVIWTPCRDMEHAGQIYSYHDVHRRRSWDDIYRATGNDSLMPTHKWMQTLGSAAIYLDTEFTVQRLRRMTQERKLIVMAEWAPYMLAYQDEVIKGGPGIQGMLMRGAVAAAGTAICRYAPEHAETFWGAIAMDDGLRNGDPRKVLLAWLRENGSDKVSGDRLLPCKAVAACYNAWCDGAERQFVKPSSMKVFSLKNSPLWKGVRED